MALYFLKPNAYHKLWQELGGTGCRQSLPGGGTAWLFYDKLASPAEGQRPLASRECRARLTRLVSNHTRAGKSKPPCLHFQDGSCPRPLLSTLSAGLVMPTASA